MTPTTHESDRLPDLVDGRLTPTEVAEVQAHLAQCPKCRIDLDRLQSARAALHSLRAEPAPAILRDVVSAALDREDARTQPRGRDLRWWAGAAAAAVLVLATAVWWAGRTSPESLVDGARVNHDAVANPGFAPDAWITPEAAALEAAFASRQDSIPPIRVIDLAMMGWTLEGGQVVRLADRSAALYGYRRPDGRRVICQMYAGVLEDLPSTSDIRQHRGFTFQVYERQGVTLVFWQEGRIVCVLASRLPPAEVVQLAFDKAMSPG